MLLSYNGIAKLIYPRLKISMLIVASLLQRLYKSCIWKQNLNRLSCKDKQRGQI